MARLHRESPNATRKGKLLVKQLSREQSAESREDCAALTLTTTRKEKRDVLLCSRALRRAQRLETQKKYLRRIAGTEPEDIRHKKVY